MRSTFKLAGLALLMSGAAVAEPATYPAMAPVAQYMMASRDAEIALARSAAPTPISADAEVLVLGAHGYVTAAKGTNGFVCMVQRGWAAGFEDPVFWDPLGRAPICLNPAAARSVLPRVLERTQWVLSGVSREEMIARTKARIAAKTFQLPEPGAMSFMMSHQGLMDDAGGHWHPHVMFFVANSDAAAWGANVHGSPVLAAQTDPEPVTIFFIPVMKWSDGTADEMPMK